MGARQYHAKAVGLGSEIPLAGGERTPASRRDQVVVRQASPWSVSVHSLLRYLEVIGFADAPQIVGSGFTSDGRETLSYIEGEFTHPGPWSLEGAAAGGRMLRSLHDATASFQPGPIAVWRSWFGCSLGGACKVIGHCDTASWNVVARDGLPVGLIDWNVARPVDPLVEIAQVCCLNAKLRDDIVAALDGLPPLRDRALQLRAIVDEYGLSASQRTALIDQIIEFVIFDTVEQANEANVLPETIESIALWGLAWCAHTATRLLRHRRELHPALL